MTRGWTRRSQKPNAHQRNIFWSVRA